MHRSATVVSAFLVCLSAFSQVQQPQPLPPAAAPGRGGRGPAPPPPQLTGEQKSQYQSKIDEIDAAVKDLRARKVNEDLIADVDIYSKAGKWLLEFPQGFVNAQNITSFLAVLDQGIERSRQLHEGQSPWVLEKGRKVLGYYSQLDGSVQPMGVTIPDGYDAGKPDRLYVWLHGRNNTLTEASFINGIKNSPQFPNTAFTADVGQLTVDCYGRGNNANHQAGEVDIFESIAAMQRRFKIDPDRILLRGFSLGGAAAWHIALQYPDRWAAAEIGAGTYPGRLMYAATPFPPYQHGPLHIYENIIDWALNAYNLPLAAHDGDADNQVATVGAGRGSAPTPNRGQLESSLRVRAQLAKEGFPSEGPDGNWTVKGTRDIFLISSNTQHGVNRDVKTRLDSFLKEYGDQGRKVPDHIRFVTYTTRYNQCFWVSLDGLEQHYERAEVDAERTGGGKQYRIATRNLTRLTLRDTASAAAINIDRQELKVKPAPQLVLERPAARGSSLSPASGPDCIRPMPCRAPSTTPFWIPTFWFAPPARRGTRPRIVTRMAILEHFDRVYAMNYRAHPRIKDDKDVTDADFAKYNVVLFGDPGSNKWIARVAAQAASEMDPRIDRHRREHFSAHPPICRSSPTRTRSTPPATSS